ncbi:hypothetical protein [Streptomyces sp. NBC_01537]|uniref:hypothetical protein n=1 Tax=Streptomyces sp. NBC_01537 TaxID=2903896 RepID=UPI0038685696
MTTPRSPSPCGTADLRPDDTLKVTGQLTVRGIDRHQFGMTVNPMGMIRGLTTVIATLRFVRPPA